jgi:hypothetical protein
VGGIGIIMEIEKLKKSQAKVIFPVSDKMESIEC